MSTTTTESRQCGPLAKMIVRAGWPAVNLQATYRTPDGHMERTERPEAPLTTSDGRGYWPVFIGDDGEAVDPWRMLELVRAGVVTFEDEDEMGNAVSDLCAKAQLGTQADEDAYWNVLGAYHRMRAQAAYERLAAMIPPPPPDCWLTAEEAAEALDISVMTLHRWAGAKIPSPTILGGVKHWRAESLAGYMSRAAGLS